MWFTKLDCGASIAERVLLMPIASRWSQSDPHRRLSMIYGVSRLPPRVLSARPLACSGFLSSLVLRMPWLCVLARRVAFFFESLCSTGPNAECPPSGGGMGYRPALPEVGSLESTMCIAPAAAPLDSSSPKSGAVGSALFLHLCGRCLTPRMMALVLGFSRKCGCRYG
ncbi:hypothetical protein Nepgr_011542 [Nepenthes gracilis]|uniref:Uncharacterized protein n=1 Tax=Nepenthes gracilis TaxID=150966 RepID=A0AAD3SFN7_NEPGR|nr:hypothetical protein Nepgr_011542 [Nepenthes gracilis]